MSRGTSGAATAPDAGSAQEAGFSPGKGPGDSLTLPGPDAPNAQFVDDGRWRVVAPADPGQLYDAAYFNGQWFVLHGRTESSGKAVASEINWLSSSRDGLHWETWTLTTQPFESYRRLASNDRSLLLVGNRHVAELADDGIDVLHELDQDGPIPVLLPHRQGYVLGRQDDIVTLGLDRAVQRVFAQDLAQFHGGSYGPRGFLLLGPFSALRSPDGVAWSPLQQHPCNSCGLAGGAVYGAGRFVVADHEALYTSDDGERWQSQAWTLTDAAAASEDKLARVDFTASHFFVRTQRGDLFSSSDAESWSPLELSAEPPGPAVCEDRCLVATGRLLLPPALAPAKGGAEL